jgi:hypothetical protein
MKSEEWAQEFPPLYQSADEIEYIRLGDKKILDRTHIVKAAVFKNKMGRAIIYSSDADEMLYEATVFGKNYELKSSSITHRRDAYEKMYPPKAPQKLQALQGLVEDPFSFKNSSAKDVSLRLEKYAVEIPAEFHDVAKVGPVTLSVPGQSEGTAYLELTYHDEKMLLKIPEVEKGMFWGKPNVGVNVYQLGQIPDLLFLEATQDRGSGRRPGEGIYVVRKKANPTELKSDVPAGFDEELFGNLSASLQSQIINKNPKSGITLSFAVLARWPKQSEFLASLKSLRLINPAPKPSLNDLPALEKLEELTIDLRAPGLDDDQLRALSGFLSHLKNLHSLKLSGSQITTIPSSITSLSNLKVLTLNFSRVSEIPASINQLSKLEKLELEGTAITEIHPSITQLRSLKSLSISNTRVSRIPEEIGNLQNLEYLLLYNTPVDHLPLSLAKLKELKVNIRDTKIQSLPDELKFLND